MMALVRYNVDQWLEENKSYFVPPICNKLMFKDGQLKAFFVGGPNSRKDFHMEAGEEFFYMLKGDMKLVVFEKGEFRDIIIKEGEVFLLPARIPHSPQRSADTLGLVIERERLPSEMDLLRYYVENSTEILYEKWFYCKSLEKLGPLIEEYFASEAFKTGKPIPGAIKKDKPIKEDFRRKLDRPFSLKTWLEQNKPEGKHKLFEGNYSSRIHVLAKGVNCPDSDLPETFLWQIEGKSTINVGDGNVELSENETTLIPSGVQYTVQNVNSSKTLMVVMNPM